MKKIINIAIDGPGGAGKSTISKAIAKKLDILYVDTGALYRTIGLFVRSKDIDPKDAEAVSAALPEISIEVKYENGAQVVYLNGTNHGDAIRTPEMSMYASHVSAIPAVRAFLLETQKQIAKTNSVIMDGRDIGTVILPDADVKIFLTASAECRAMRRYKELCERGQDVKYEDVLAEMNERDAQDSSREIAPAKPAEDAIFLDNSDLSFEQSVDAIIEIVKKNCKDAFEDESAENAEDTKTEATGESDKKTEKKKKRNGSRSYRIIYPLFSGIVKLVLNIKVINTEKEPSDGGFLVCANHTSGADPIVLSYAFKKNQVHFMAKKELFKIPLLAQLIKLLGAFPVDRAANDIGAVRKAITLIEEDKCMGIFPQGHRYPGEDPRKTKTKNGLALIATKSHADVVPCYIWRKKKKFKLFRRTYVIIGDRIPFEELNFNPEVAGEYVRITDIAFDKICTLGEEFEAQLEQEKAAKKARKKGSAK